LHASGIGPICIFSLFPPQFSKEGEHEPALMVVLLHGVVVQFVPEKASTTTLL